MHAGAGERVQEAVRGARQARLGAEAAASEAGPWARQAGWDGSWCYRVSHCVVDWLVAHRKACWTFFYTALLKEVVPRVTLCNTGKINRSTLKQKTQKENQDDSSDS